MKYEKVKNFCFSEGNRDDELEEAFRKEDGNKIIYRITSQINEYANQLNCVCHTINILEDWKKETFFKINETTYKINWFGTYKSSHYKEDVTLPQAQRLYREIKVKYDALYELFEECAEVHYKEEPRIFIDKYFSYTKY
ncbi:hypothetical protein OD350_28880 (plasmid) [Clostridium beijerinckii]|uniref:hypothetical protein n=1 Tax=Clostridium beijerinckii TaxID=1520 RepID=UPI00222644DC|nr:hypothetical protein [Clostridium beijerinckii]UYZ39090.1 hypothetical protein OD350_28880 [Clostridium beijerinckii]